jgi:hypothetical protein
VAREKLDQRSQLVVAQDALARRRFTYGSLSWDPGNVRPDEERIGYLEGWHREWTWISRIRRHGAPTCSLSEGGRLKGEFLRLNPSSAIRALEEVRQRETSDRAASPRCALHRGPSHTSGQWGITCPGSWSLQHLCDRFQSRPESVRRHAGEASFNRSSYCAIKFTPKTDTYLFQAPTRGVSEVCQPRFMWPAGPLLSFGNGRRWPISTR